MAEEGDQSFAPPTRKALDRYFLGRIKVVGGALGVANLGILLGSLWYVFFLLPKAAHKQAVEVMGNEIRAQVQTQVSVLTDSTMRTIESVGEAKANMSAKMAEFEGQQKALITIIDLAKTGTEKAITKTKELEGEVDKTNARMNEIKANVIRAEGGIRISSEPG